MSRSFVFSVSSLSLPNRSYQGGAEFLITTQQNKKLKKMYNSLYFAGHQLERGIRLGYIERHFYLLFKQSDTQTQTQTNSGTVLVISWLVCRVTMVELLLIVVWLLGLSHIVGRWRHHATWWDLVETLRGRSVLERCPVGSLVLLVKLFWRFLHIFSLTA